MKLIYGYTFLLVLLLALNINTMAQHSMIILFLQSWIPQQPEASPDLLPTIKLVHFYCAKPLGQLVSRKILDRYMSNQLTEIGPMVIGLWLGSLVFLFPIKPSWTPIYWDVTAASGLDWLSIEFPIESNHFQTKECQTSMNQNSLKPHKIPRNEIH